MLHVFISLKHMFTELSFDVGRGYPQNSANARNTSAAMLLALLGPVHKFYHKRKIHEKVSKRDNVRALCSFY